MTTATSDSRSRAIAAVGPTQHCAEKVSKKQSSPMILCTTSSMHSSVGNGALKLREGEGCVVGGIHCKAPSFIEAQYGKTRPISISIELSGCLADTFFSNNILASSPVYSWNAWGSWGSCSTTCAGGFQTRTRTCSDGTNTVADSFCGAPSSQSKGCNNVDCGKVNCLIINIQGDRKVGLHFLIPGN